MEKRDLSSYISMAKRNKDTADPGVISDEMIREYVRKHNEEHRIFGMDHVPLNQIRELRLSYQNIIVIQNLDHLNDLRTLYLDNNIIEHIEGLESLVMLEWLDLSFNSITVVEGLDSLAQLTDLSLYSNKIKEVDGGLDNCKLLNVLSIGCNKIATFDPTIKYLGQFDNLQVINLAGNDVCKNPDYTSRVVAYLDKLKYLDYRIITEDERQKALAEHSDEIKEKDRLRAKGEEEQKREEDEEEARVLEKANIQRTQNIKNQLKEAAATERDGHLSWLPGEAEKFDDYLEAVSELTTVFQKDIFAKNNERQRKIAAFSRTTEAREKELEQHALELIEELNKNRKMVFRRLEEEGEDLPTEEMEEQLIELKQKIMALEETLMDEELQYFDSANSAFATCSAQLQAIKSEISIKAEDYSKDQKKLLAEYVSWTNQELLKNLNKYHGENANLDQFSKELSDLLKDKETALGYVSQIDETHGGLFSDIVTPT